MQGRWLCVLLFAAYASRAQAQSDDGGIEAAREAMESGDVERARTLFEALTRTSSVRDAAAATYWLAVLDDDALRFEAALARYRDFVVRDPGSRFAARAQARIDDLVAHNEGGFAPLTSLERVRRDETLANTVQGIEGLERAIESFPPGPVRAEARLLVGEAYLNRLARARDAARVLRTLAEDASASQELRSLAAEKLIEARAQLGEERAAVRELAPLRVDAEVKQSAVVLARRSVLRRSAWSVLALTVVAGAFALLRAVLRGEVAVVLKVWRRPLPLAQLAMLTVGGGALAKLYDDHEMGPFLMLGVGSLGVYLSATAWNVVGASSPAARIARAALCLVAVLAVSFLAMDTLDPMMLEGINL
jgi:tetratricopeptide (TPR) repeat protein